MDKKMDDSFGGCGDTYFIIGAVYAWSVFTRPIMEYMAVSLKDVQFAFSIIAILFLGFSASFWVNMWNNMVLKKRV